MANAQEYLNNKYPNKEIITEIDTREWRELNLEESLEGILKFENFNNLKSITFDKEVIKNIKEIEFNNLPELQIIKFNIGFQDVSKIKETKTIKLVNLLKLEAVLANHCKLEKIEINNCPEITDLRAGNNLLTNLNFLEELKKNPTKLKILSIHSNNFAEQDLSFLNGFVNLEQLFLDNCDKGKIWEGKYNRFIGSLQPLQNLTKLEYLSISNTDITVSDSESALDYLPKKSLEAFYCSSKLRPESKVKEIAEQENLENFLVDENSSKYDLTIGNDSEEKWENIHPNFGGMLGKWKQKQWKEQGFTYEKTRSWIKFGNLKPEEVKFASYLQAKNSSAESWGFFFNEDLKDELRRKYNNRNEKDPQNWLDKVYPKEKRLKTSEIIIDGRKLEGVLSFENLGFDNLETLIINPNYSESEKLLKEIITGKITELDVRWLSKLKVLLCNYNQLTNLKLAGCKNLTKLSLAHNQLTNAKLLNNLPRKEKLTFLDIAYNNFFPYQKLDFLKPFTNLEELYIENYDERKMERKESNFLKIFQDNKDTHNRFYGSLGFLWNITKLKILDISNTDIEEGLEYLPDSLEKLICNNSEVESFNSKVIEEQLKLYGGRIRDWRISNIGLFQKNWIEISPKFTDQELIKKWLSKDFTREQVKKLTKGGVGITVNDIDFAYWIKEVKKMTVEKDLDEKKVKEFREEYEKQKLEAQIEIPPKK